MKKIYFLLFTFIGGCFLAHGLLENEKQYKKELTVSRNITVDIPYFDERFEDNVECYARIENKNEKLDEITPVCKAGTPSAVTLKEKGVKNIFLSKSKMTGIVEDIDKYRNEEFLYFNIE